MQCRSNAAGLLPRAARVQQSSVAYQAGDTKVEVEDMKRIGLAMCLPMLWTSAVLIGQEPSPRAPASAAPAQQGSSDSNQDAVWTVGRYVYYADAATFVDCVGGSRYPVAQERDNAALEAAYLEARPEPMAELVVALEGHLARRPSRDGDRQATVVIVERFAGIRGSGGCPANVDLERTTWDVLAFDGDDLYDQQEDD